MGGWARAKSTCSSQSDDERVEQEELGRNGHNGPFSKPHSKRRGHQGFTFRKKEGDNRVSRGQELSANLKQVEKGKKPRSEATGVQHSFCIRITSRESYVNRKKCRRTSGNIGEERN